MGEMIASPELHIPKPWCDPLPTIKCQPERNHQNQQRFSLPIPAKGCEIKDHQGSNDPRSRRDQQAGKVFTSDAHRGIESSEPHSAHRDIGEHDRHTKHAPSAQRVGVNQHPGDAEGQFTSERESY